jgi:4a-hydroxytetrahydrobiopterin dehydratase
MTEARASKTCTPCRGGISPLTREQAELFHAQAPDWQLAEEAHRIERSFRMSTRRRQRVDVLTPTRRQPNFLI